MTRGFLFSGLVHTAPAVLLYFGLPRTAEVLPVDEGRSSVEVVALQ